jgi:ubiquinone/menaquinone biosynthesis C-methylase UbiE
MPPLAFAIMSLIMNVKKRKRNIEEEIGLAKPVKGNTVLDFGCGLGFNSIPAAKFVGKEGKVFALDISKQAVDLVNKKAGKAKLGNITTIHSDCATGLEDESVEVVYLHNVLPLIRNKKAVLKEIMRVLRKGGRLSVTTGKIARNAGQDTMSDEDLTIYMQNEYYCKLVNNVNGHLVFQK